MPNNFKTVIDPMEQSVNNLRIQSGTVSGPVGFFVTHNDLLATANEFAISICGAKPDAVKDSARENSESKRKIAVRSLGAFQSRSDGRY